MPFGTAPQQILSIAEYNLLGQLIGAVLVPYTTALTNQLNAATPLLPLSPADAALAVIRNELSEADAAGEAAMSGINASRFHTLTRLTGDAPAAEGLAVALRRGFIDEARYLLGVRQGRLRDEWADTIKQLATEDPPASLALLADLKAQLPTAEARALYAKLGGNPDHYDVAYHVEGAAPSPLEVAEAARRGIVPWDGLGAESVSFAQAVHESAYRNKWEAVYRELAVYLPPPRTVTAMLKEGALTEAQARDLFTKAGLPPELVAAYLAAASGQKQAHTKELAESTVVTLYHDRLVTTADAKVMLTALGYNDAEATFILEVEDMRLAQHYLGLAVSRIHALYVGHRISRATVVSVLPKLGVDATGASDLLGLWDWERAANVKELTAAQVGAALKHGIIAQDAAQTMLEQQGYPPHDAWLYLSVVMAKALPGEPPADATLAAPGA